MDENKNTHGGKREGAGRPKGSCKPSEELATQHKVYATKKEWKIFQKNGGSKTLRKLINQGLFKEP